MTNLRQPIRRVETPSYEAAIYVAGDIHAAKQTCQAFVFSVGLCVTVTPTEFIYTGGRETGVRVGLINYPRFPAEPSVIFETAETLARVLIAELQQHSASVVATDRTVWLTRREEDRGVL